MYELGNGQWNIPVLKSLLEKILPEKKIVKDYKVEHIFEKIGRKTIALNARQIDTVQLIILAMEDITAKEKLEKKLANYTEKLEITVKQRTKELAKQVEELKRVNKVMIGRETKMIELKTELKKLRKPQK